RDGLDTLREIREKWPRLPVLMISTFSAEEYVGPALEAGARGYLLKEATLSQLEEAVRVALSDSGTYLHPAVTESMLRWRKDGTGGPLSERELAVLRLVAAGSTNEQIASALF